MFVKRNLYFCERALSANSRHSNLELRRTERSEQFEAKHTFEGQALCSTIC